MTYKKKVIYSEKPSGDWRFFDFVQGDRPISVWYDNELSESAQFLFDGLLKNIRSIESPYNWSCFRHFMKGQLKGTGIWELGFFADGKQYRVLSIFGPNRKQVTFLIGCYHKGRVYTPTDTLEQAYKRSKALQLREAQVLERTVKDDI